MSSYRVLFTKSTKVIVAFSLLILLVLNIAASQLVPASYFSFIEGDRAAAVQFLKSIKLLPEFPRVADSQRQIFGENLDQEVFETEQKREVEITNLEKLLEKNPNAPDILYGLSVLYTEKGDQKKAQIYLKRAQELDPMVGKSMPGIIN